MKKWVGSCLSSSAAAVAPEVLSVIETAVQAAVHAAVVELLSDLHLSINAGRVLGGLIAMEPAKLG